MNLYSIDIRIVGTVYVKANNEREAHKKLRNLKGGDFAVEGGSMISNLEFTDPDLPEISLSPVMTLDGPWRDESLQLVEENVPESNQ